MKKYKISELHNNYDIIPTTSGIYFVEVPENFVIEFSNETTGRKIYKGKDVKIYDITELNQKFLAWDKITLYIGKADCLQERIKAYIKWGYNESGKAHDGGKAIWQINNNPELLIWWEENNNPLQEEQKRLKEYKEKYGVYPLANWRC